MSPRSACMVCLELPIPVGSVIGYVLAPQPHWQLVLLPSRTATSNGSTRLLMNVGVSIPVGVAGADVGRARTLYVSRRIVRA